MPSNKKNNISLYLEYILVDLTKCLKLVDEYNTSKLCCKSETEKIYYE